VKWIKALWDRTPLGRLAILEARMAGLCVCPSCGSVMVSGHPGGRTINAPDGAIQVCKWDHARIAEKAKAPRSGFRN